MVRLVSENNQSKRQAPQESGELTVAKTANRNPKVGNGQCGAGKTQKTKDMENKLFVGNLPWAATESDITQFLRTLKDNKPELEDAQQAGRLLLWDKTPIALDDSERARTVKVKQKPYVYQPD